MAELSTIRKNGVDYGIKDATARQAIEDLKKAGTGSGTGNPSGGNADYVGVEPAEDDIPKVFITGVKPTTKADVLAEMEYISKTDKFHAYLTIKCQGTSSMSYPKKNFTVKLYSDEARETKLKKDFKDWNHESNKFVLKANYIDHAHARNIVSARLWGEVVASRPDYDSLPVEMRNAPNNGAVDGFPIKVYYNGNYEGVYTWNIGKDDWMWGMDEDNVNHVLLCAEGNTDGVYAETTSNFRALWNGVDGQKPGWSVEVGTNSTALKNSLNNLIQFVMDNDGDNFRNGISQYLDIQSAIDYYIFQYEICGLDGLAHNMLLATYDGVVWRCGAYDLDATFGLWWNGTSFVSATYACPEDYQERYSLLWERIEANFIPELKARQIELRKTVLSYSNIVTHFERFMDIIGLDLYAEDLTIYTAIPSGSTNNIKQIRNYIRDRQAYVDAEFAAMNGEATEPEEPDNPEPTDVPCTGISLDKSTLSFTAEGTQTLTATVTPDGCTDPVIWESDNTSVATVNGGMVTAIANGSATITAYCGEYSASCTVSVSGTEIPDEYTKLAYIQSSGTQYINTGVLDGDETAILTSGACIASETGNVVPHNNGRYTEEYIPIPDGAETYCLTDVGTTNYSMAFYDSEYQYISGYGGKLAENMAIPEGASFMRVSIFSASVNGVGVKFTDSTYAAEYEIKFDSLGTTETNWDQYLCGAKVSSIPKINNSALGNIGIVCGWGDKDIVLLTTQTAGENVYKYNADGTFMLNDVVVIEDTGTAGNGWGDEPWYVCNSHGEPTLMASMKLYYLRMWTNGALVRSFVPAKRNSDGAIGLYDRVTQAFYENAGTGTFTYA